MVGNVLDAIRAYFDKRNEAWFGTVDNDDMASVASSGPHTQKLSPADSGVVAQRRSFRRRGVQLVRTHTVIEVCDVAKQADDGEAVAVVDERVNWTYLDGLDVQVESRVIRHWQKWRLQGDQWTLVQTRVSGEGERMTSRTSADLPPAAGSLGAERMDYPGMRARCDWYDRVRAVRFAELWWNGWNPAYAQLEDDCTNFISQCLHAGNMRMTGGQSRASGWWYKFGAGGGWSYSWTTANALAQYLLNRAQMQPAASARDLRYGDVIFYDWDGSGRYRHSAIVVDFDRHGEPLVNAHTDASYHRHWSYADSRSWTPNTRYLFIPVPDEVCH